MKVIVSGLVNIETTLKIRGFPISYYPIDYPFFGVHSDVAGVAYNLTRAFKSLGDSAMIFSFLGNDDEGERILKRLKKDEIAIDMVQTELVETPCSIVLYDEEGKRQIYCDLKDIQEKQLEISDSDIRSQIRDCDLVAACNINFNRPLLKTAKEMGKRIATDVHVLSDIEDSFNREFMEYADILFLSDENLPCEPEKFIRQLAKRYGNQVIVIGMGSRGAMLYEKESDKVFCMEAVKCDKVVNTVGAGDALFSGFLHYYLKGYRSVEALMRAELFASMKIGYNGAANGFCDEKTVENEFLKRKPKVHFENA